MAATSTNKMSAWLALSRAPFHSVGVLPYLLGGVLAWWETGVFHWGIVVWGTLGVVLVMLATYYAGEYWDHKEDALSVELPPNRFAGGSGVVQSGAVPRRAALWASLASLALASVVGLILQFGYGTGPWTIPLGMLGMFGGFFYSTRPVRWVSTGVGELWIAFCYGWLPVATGYYLQVSRLTSLVAWVSIPIGLTIFNVILLNEYPDYPADKAAGKRNMVVRLRPDRASYLYGVVGAVSWIAFLFSLTRGVPTQALWIYVPVMLISLAVVVMVVRGRWRDPAILERLCGGTLVVNLGTTVAYILAFVV